MENVYVTQNEIKPIEVRLTENKGFGVFATEDIKANTLIEKCYCIKVDDSYENVPFALKDYTFNYPRQNTEGVSTIQVLPLGYGCIYNHSETPNAKWEDAEEHMFFNFSTIKDIRKGEEICTYYGPDYWKQHKNRNEDEEMV